MSGLAGILVGRLPAGVYQWKSTMEVDEVRESVDVAGWSLGHLQGWRGPSKSEFLRDIGLALNFPDYYGVNLDALNDCLRDLLVPTVLVWDDWGLLAEADPASFDLALRVLTDRAVAEQRPPFAVLLRGLGPDLPQVADLD